MRSLSLRSPTRPHIDVPLARHAISSVGALSFKIGDLSPPKPAKPADGDVDLTSFADLTTQVDAPAMSDMLNDAITDGPVWLPEAVAMLDTAYLGHVIVRSGPGPHPAQPRLHHRPLPLARRPRPRNRRAPFDIHRTHQHPRGRYLTPSEDVAGTRVTWVFASEL